MPPVDDPPVPVFPPPLLLEQPVCSVAKATANVNETASAHPLVVMGASLMLWGDGDYDH
jgi:hypothetical protein